MAQQAQTFPVSAGVLRWARRRAGVSDGDAAATLGLTPHELRTLEDKGGDVRVSSLERLSGLLNISVTAFFLPAPPEQTPAPTDFRTIGSRAPSLTEKTIQAITKIETLQLLASELMDALDRPPPELWRISVGDSPETRGREARALLGVTDTEQLRFSDATDAYKHWRTRIEDVGVLVFQENMPRNECRGFSLVDASAPPAIAVNSVEAPQARVFTALHEYGHVLLRAGGICNELESGGAVEAERFCNRFAAAALMPKPLLERVVADLRINVASWTDDDVRRVARRVKVSKPATALRLEQVGLAPPMLYGSLDMGWDHDSWQSAGGGPVPQPTQIFNRLGTGYVGLVLSALDSGAIDILESSDFTRSKAKHLVALRRRFEQEVETYSTLSAT